MTPSGLSPYSRREFLRTLPALALVARMVAAEKPEAGRENNIPLPLSKGRTQWTTQQVNDWYAQQPWMAGANHLPRSAINQLEMWQAATFDPKMIDEEMGWAQGLGFNAMRIFLHDLLWQQDAEGFLQRIEQVLALCDRHGIRVMPVFFDSCWHPLPKLGPQPTPKAHTHNSGWVQSPGREILEDETKWPALKPYVNGIISRFRDDQRILLWGTSTTSSTTCLAQPPTGPMEIPDKKERSLRLAQQVRAWGLAANPTQPVSCCL